MRGLSAGCGLGFLVACGGRASHDDVRPAPADAGGSGVVGAGGIDAVDVAGAGADAAVSLEPGTCMSGTPAAMLSGNIAGVATTLDLVGNSSATGLPVVSGTWWDLRARSPDSALLAWGTGSPDGRPQQAAGALIVVPKPGKGSTFYCAASVAASSSPANVGHAASIALTELSVLGECPGAPASGEVEVCLDGSEAGGGCSEDFGVRGTIDGAELQLRQLGGITSVGNVGDEFQAWVMGDRGDGSVSLFANTGGRKLTGWLRLPNDAASNAGSVFCLSDASVVPQANDGYSITFRSVGRLGACPGVPVAGELGYCYRSD